MYTSSRLNNSTYLVVQNDKYSEFPFIYVKIYSDHHLAVVLDTGCGPQSATDHTAQLADLKDFIEDRVLGLNEASTEKYEYLVVCTHCHFDHISGLASFAAAGASILASAYNKTFLSPENLPANSLCEAFGLETPRYSISRFAEDGERIQHGEKFDLGLKVLHTPGHTPDSLALYDEQERWIFVGDTCYKRVATMPWGERQDVPIVFPLQGSWDDFVETLEKLAEFVKAEDESAQERPIKMACGHTTSDVPAAGLLAAVTEFSRSVAMGKVPVMARLRGDEVAPGGSLGEGMFVFWQDDGEPEFSLCAPESFERQFESNVKAPESMGQN